MAGDKDIESSSESFLRAETTERKRGLSLGMVAIVVVVCFRERKLWVVKEDGVEGERRDTVGDGRRWKELEEVIWSDGESLGDIEFIVAIFEDR